MKNLRKLCCVLIATAICTQLFAQNGNEAKERKQSPEEQAWMAYATPGKMHEMLAKNNGMWTEDVTFWMAPGAPPQKMTATCMNRMTMGGRYQQANTRGTFNGMPFEGMSTFGYDNAKKVFMSTWIDNMGTGITNMEGTYDEATKTVTMKGMMVDPASGKEIAARQTMKFIDDKNHLMEMFNTPAGGKEFKSMEIKFSKKEIEKMPMAPGGPGGRPIPPSSPQQQQHEMQQQRDLQEQKPADKK